MLSRLSHATGYLVNVFSYINFHVCVLFYFKYMNEYLTVCSFVCLLVYRLCVCRCICCFLSYSKWYMSIRVYVCYFWFTKWMFLRLMLMRMLINVHLQYIFYNMLLGFCIWLLLQIVVLSTSALLVLLQLSLLL